MRALQTALVILFAFIGMTATSHADVKVQKLSPEEIVSYIQAKQGRRVVIIYTSWCPYCRKVMPEMVELEQEYDGAVVPISIDKDSDTLGRYLAKFEEVPFPVIQAEELYKNHLKQVLKRTGINHPGQIPYMALIDENGKVAIQGTLKAQDVRNFIEG